MTASVDVIVVGAGLAGLTAAADLRGRGLSVLVVEARDRVGGRTACHEVAGQPLDAGGAWVGGRHRAVRDLAARLGVAMRRNEAPGAGLFDIRGRIGRIGDPVPGFSALALGDVLDRLETLAEEVDPERPWALPSASEMDRLSVADWAAREFRHPDASLVVGLLTHEMLAADPADVSVLHFLFYVRSGGGVRYLTAFSGGAQQERFMGGAHTLAERLAATPGLPVRLNTAVSGIRLDAASLVRVEGHGWSLACERVVVAVPPGMAARIEMRGPGGAVGGVARPTASGGSAVKLHMVYGRPFWRDAGLSGWASADRGPVRFTVDDSAGREELGVLVGFVTGRDARRWTSTSPAERRRAILERLVRWFGPEAGKPMAFLERNWQTEEFVEGCWAAVPEFGRWTTSPPSAPDGREVNDRLYVCGTERSSAFYGHLEGAVRSGHATAARLLGAPTAEAVR